jgi:hypothetical protein
MQAQSDFELGDHHPPRELRRGLFFVSGLDAIAHAAQGLYAHAGHVACANARDQIPARTGIQRCGVT